MWAIGGGGISNSVSLVSGILTPSSVALSDWQLLVQKRNQRPQWSYMQTTGWLNGIGGKSKITCTPGILGNGEEWHREHSRFPIWDKILKLAILKRFRLLILEDSLKGPFGGVMSLFWRTQATPGFGAPLAGSVMATGAKPAKQVLQVATLGFQKRG